MTPDEPGRAGGVKPWRPSRALQAVLDQREMERNRNYLAEFFHASGAAESDAIDRPGFAAWLRQQHTKDANRMATVIEIDLRSEPSS